MTDPLIPQSECPDAKNIRLFNILREAIGVADTPVTIGITGAGGAGKTTLASNIAAWYSPIPTVNIDLDDYLIPRSQRDRLGLTGYHPQANDLGLARQHIVLLKAGKPIEKPTYDHRTREVGGGVQVQPAQLLIFEGVTTLYPEMNDLYDIVIFMDAKEETQIKSRVERDVNKRGYSLDDALTLFESLKPAYRQFIAPTKKHAHLVGIVGPDYVFQPENIDPHIFQVTR